MNSVGVFRKVEMDKKLFLVYTSTQTCDPTSSSEALAMDSDGDDLSLQPHLFCPAARIRYHFLNLRNKEEEDGEEEEVVLRPIKSSPHFPSTRTGNQQGQAMLDCDYPGICKLPVVPLFWCNDRESSYYKFDCGACKQKTNSASYYACLECQGKFHKECVESALEIKHPFHPFHSLRLNHHSTKYSCHFCIDYFSYPGIGYDCTICKLSMHPVCAKRPISFVVENPKSHPHPLTLFPTQASTVCNICAQIKKFDPTYICIQCVFVIHKNCMDFPHVIRISRHPHRISFTVSLPSRKLSCGVCRQEVDNRYGAYSCNKCDVGFVHSKCALHSMVWDGKELEGISEEEDKIDDGEPFKRIADGIILHPFHSHHLRLEIFRGYDENKYCRGCSLPIYEGQFYSCMECDFILHESCANAPRMKRHPLYPYPLTLDTMTSGHQHVTDCMACQRDICGFYYWHYSEEKEIHMTLDLRCASVIEPFEFQGHMHPLFLPWVPEENTHCQICKRRCHHLSKLYCTECDYTICFRCATLPQKVRYKHDSHFLTICDGIEANDQPDWCEICEGKIEELKEKAYGKEERRIYKCDDCCTTLHAECLLGADVYMKAGKTIENGVSTSMFRPPRRYMDVHILLNSSLSRPICDGCYRRSPFPIYFKVQNRNFCSWRCTKNAEYEHPTS